MRKFRELALVVGIGLVAGISFVIVLIKSPTDWLPWKIESLLARTGTDEIFSLTMRAHLRRLDRSVKMGDVIFLGDSHVQAMNVSSVTHHGVNFGIGGDTVETLVRRMAEYPSLNLAGAVVISAGFNDLKRRSVDDITRDMEKALAMTTVAVVLTAVPPVNLNRRPDLPHDLNERINQLNKRFSQVCRSPCRFVSAEAFAVGPDGNHLNDDGDGIHINSAGYDRWVDQIRAALSSATGSDSAR